MADQPGPSLIVVTGWTGAGKSTIADHIALEIGATVASYDWVMSGLRAQPEAWAAIEEPDVQRRVAWNLLSRVAEQQLRRGASCVLDLVAREEPIAEWRALADRYDARFGVVECTCSDPDVHRARVEGRDRDIPGWYELTWEQAQSSSSRYQPVDGDKLLLDAVEPIESNAARVTAWLHC